MNAKPLFPNQTVTAKGDAPSQDLTEIIKRIVNDLTTQDSVTSPLLALLIAGNSGKDVRVNSAGDGYEVYLRRDTSAADQTITLAGSSASIGHSLGVVPRGVMAELVCQTAELGFSIGDVVPVAPNTAGSIRLFTTIWAIRFASAISIPHNTTGVSTAITAANWKLRVTPYA